MLLGIRRAVSRTRPSQRLARPIPPLANLESTFSFIHPTVIVAAASADGDDGGGDSAARAFQTYAQ